VFSVSIAPTMTLCVFTCVASVTEAVFLLADWLRPNVLTDSGSEMKNWGYPPWLILVALLRGLKVNVNL
jgi:hypothetical protein